MIVDVKDVSDDLRCDLWFAAKTMEIEHTKMEIFSWDIISPQIGGMWTISSHGWFESLFIFSPRY